jgi:hypothetical protein
MQHLKIKSIKKIPKTDRYDLTVSETSNFFANGILIHNTSARFTHAKVKKLNFIQKKFITTANRLLTKFNNKKQSKLLPWIEWGISKVDYLFHKLFKEQYEYDYIAGSREVIKDIGSNQSHYYEMDIWNHWLEKVKTKIPKNYVLYGEIIGWINNTPIQKNYTYNLPEGESDFYVYRITIVNEDGFVTDLSWRQIKDFCLLHDLKHVPELWKGHHRDFDALSFMDKKYYISYPQSVRLADNSPCDEGVCVRKEGFYPYVSKAKSPIFIAHESKAKDQNARDIEEEQSGVEE